MQITFIRHGQYNTFTGHLTDKGIDTITKTALVLNDMRQNPKYRPEIPDRFNLEKTASNEEKASLSELFQIATGVWGNEFLEAKLHADLLPDIILSSQMPRAIESAQVLREQLMCLGGNPKLQTGVAYLNEVRASAHGTAPSASNLHLTELTDFLMRLGKEGYQHIAIVTHQPNIQGFGYAFVASQEPLPTPTPGSILSIYPETPEDIISGRHFSYGRTGVCDWTENLPHESVEKQIREALAQETTKVLDVSQIREKLKSYKDQDKSTSPTRGQNTL